nr:FAD-linked oxidase C-terminal domain-containing protein [Candidatus Sigynarchaeota archaeon]
MGHIIIHQDKVVDPATLVGDCPFDALAYDNAYLSITAGCKMCKACVKKHPDVFEYVEDVIIEINKLMRGIKKVFDPNNILNPGKIV